MMNRTVFQAVKYFMPYGVVQQVIRSKASARRRLAAHKAAQASATVDRVPYSYGAAIEFHCSRGLTRDHVVSGSMPEASLDYCCQSLNNLIQTDKPLVGLHVGNFLGVSLSHFANYVRQRNDESVIISIDPNLTHRGIENTQNHVVAILNQFGLQRNTLICVGYSMNKSISNDGVAFVGEDGTEYDPYARHNGEQSCEKALSNLCLFSRGRFDFAVVDGNHEGKYVHREAELVRTLLKPEGVLILDDVSEAWEEIKEEYDNLRSEHWRAVGADGRVGLLQGTS
jgi:Methyltransferase domain